MMKQIIRLGAVTLFLCGAMSVDATLIDQHNGVIYDDIANQYWVQDASAFYDTNYATQIASIAQLNNPITGLIDSSWGDWRMANSTDISSLFGTYDGIDITSKFTPKIHNYANGIWYTYQGRYDQSWAGGWHRVAGYTINMAGDLLPTTIYAIPDSSISSIHSTWIVADRITNPVPEPSTMFLLGTGLAVLAGFGRRKQVTS